MVNDPEKIAGIKAFAREKFPDIPEEELDHMVNDAFVGETWMNDTYTVIVRPAEKLMENFPDMIWISIKRNDRAPIHDWRDLQEIKNIFAGEEAEAVELYPSKSRLVDTANQYHLWAFKDPSIRFPFGFVRGFTDYAPEKFGAVQRPE